mgnify:CR=1 FL=1
MANEHGEQIRIVQETVAGKEITFAHVMGGPAPIIYQKLGLNPQLDYRSSAIGIMNMTPPESAVIASDIAVKSGKRVSGICRPFYRNTDHNRRDFRCADCNGRNRGLFP